MTRIDHPTRIAALGPAVKRDRLYITVAVIHLCGIVVLVLVIISPMRMAVENGIATIQILGRILADNFHITIL